MHSLILARKKDRRRSPTMRSAGMALAVGLLMVAAPFAAFAVGQSISTSASVRVVDGFTEMVIGPYIVESGARLAIELACQQASLCEATNVIAEQCLLTGEDGDDAAIRALAAPEGMDALTWIAVIELVDDTREPLAEGRYHLTLETSIGTFTALLDVVPVEQFGRYARFTGTAMANGLSLRISRMVTPDDAGGRIALRLGDELLVALPGNPTTGFEWMADAPTEPMALQPIDEIPYEYRADSELDQVGTPGTFLFRYHAEAPGSQPFRFVYARPWESVEPEEVFEFTAVVY